jgi:FtsH-binding integral membrane protein
MANGFDPRVTAAPRTGGTAGREGAGLRRGLRSYMLSVYNYMASGVLLTGIVALLFARAATRPKSSGAGHSKYVIMFAPLRS